MVLSTKLAGVSYGDRQKNIKSFAYSDLTDCKLIREPENEYDFNAVKVVVGSLEMGYLPKIVAANIAPEMDSGKRFTAQFECLNQHHAYDQVGLKINIFEVAF